MPKVTVFLNCSKFQLFFNGSWSRANVFVKFLKYFTGNYYSSSQVSFHI